MSALTRAEVLRARSAGFIPERQGRAGQVVSAILRRRRPEATPWPPRKEQARCCMALVDEHGRPPLGFCSPECIRRPGNWGSEFDGPVCT